MYTVQYRKCFSVGENDKQASTHEFHYVCKQEFTGTNMHAWKWGAINSQNHKNANFALH